MFELKNCPKVKSPKTLVCHDMKGGYLGKTSDHGILTLRDRHSPVVLLYKVSVDVVWGLYCNLKLFMVVINFVT